MSLRSILHKTLSAVCAGELGVRHLMKFFTLVLLNNQDLSDSAVEAMVQKNMEPHKLIEDDDLPYNSDWKWDYFVLYEKDYMKKLGFEPPEFNSILEHSAYVVYPIEELEEKHMSFALVTPEGNWHNGSYPLEDEDLSWPSRALSIANESKAKYGVFVYTHS